MHSGNELNSMLKKDIPDKLIQDLKNMDAGKAVVLCQFIINHAREALADLKKIESQKNVDGFFLSVDLEMIEVNARMIMEYLKPLKIAEELKQEEEYKKLSE